MTKPSSSRREPEYTQNTPAGNPSPFRGRTKKFTLMAKCPSTPVQSLNVWVYTLPGGRGNGIAGLKVTWSSPSDNNSEETAQSAGRCHGPPTKRFEFGKRERIQIMYVYAEEHVDGLWFVTDGQRSFFPGKSSTRFDMVNLGNGVLVGFEGVWDEEEEGFLTLGANFRNVS